MQIIKRSLVPMLGALLLASACNVSTAHISSLKLGKDEAVKQESTTFAPTDTIYAVAEIGNAGKTKDKGQLVIVDVAGQQPGPIPVSRRLSIWRAAAPRTSPSRRRPRAGQRASTSST